MFIDYVQFLQKNNVNMLLHASQSLLGSCLYKNVSVSKSQEQICT